MMFNGRMGADTPVWRTSSPPPSLRWKASRVISFPTGWARPWTYGINIIITLPIQRDCPGPIPSALIGQTAGNQDRKHRGITQEASGAASHSRWMTRSQKASSLQLCALQNAHFWSGTARHRGRARHIASSRHGHYAR